MEKIRTAVVGAGNLGRYHLKWYSQLDSSELVGLFDTDRDRSAHYAAQYNITAFESLEELAQLAEAVSIAVPTSAHYEVASQLVRRGVHCLIEKPVTSLYEDAVKLAELANRSGARLTVGQIERFNPAVRALSGLDIRPSFIEAHRLAAFDPRGTDVAVVLDLMIHDIDLTLMSVKSRIADIQASAVAVVSEKPDIANARLTFANGAVANLTASRISLQAMRKLRIFQKSGYYSLDLAKKRVDIYRLADREEYAEGLRLPLGKSGQDVVYVKKGETGEDMLGLELETFLNALVFDHPMAVSLEEGIEALRVALEVERIGCESANRLSLIHI